MTDLFAGMADRLDDDRVEDFGVVMLRLGKTVDTDGRIRIADVSRACCCFKEPAACSICLSSHDDFGKPASAFSASCSDREGARAPMLMDWLHYLTTPAPLAFRRLGFVRDSIWLQSRSRRCREAWKDHLSRSRRLIIDAIDDLPRRRTAIILGSGLLDDVPIDALATAFETVVLVDVVHPWPARLATRRHSNVRRISFDLSGSAGWMLGGAEGLGPALPGICFDPQVDLIVSANVMSQLPILPLDWFAERGRAIPHLGERIVSAHLDGLAGLDARICLVTDVEQVEEDRSERITERSDLLHGVRLGPPDRRWDWTLAPFGEAARDARLVHRVHGYRDWCPLP